MNYKKNSLDVGRTTDCIHDLKINDVQGRTTSNNDLLKIELIKDNLKKLDLALCGSDQIRRKQPMSFSMLKAMVANVLEEQLQNSFIAQQEKGRVKDTAIREDPVPSRDPSSPPSRGASRVTLQGSSFQSLEG